MAPEPPSDLTPQPTQTQVTLTWTIPGDTPDNVQVYRATQLLVTLAASTASYTDHGPLQPGTLYDYAVCCVYGSSSLCSSVVTRTQGTPPQPPNPTPPTPAPPAPHPVPTGPYNVTAKWKVPVTEATVTWTPGLNTVYYEVNRYHLTYQGGAWQQVLEQRYPKVNATHLDDSGLAGGPYQYAVVAHNPHGTSQATSNLLAPPPAPLPETPPTMFIATLVGLDHVHLSWEPGYGNSSFDIDRERFDFISDQWVPVSNIATGLAGTITTHEDVSFIAPEFVYRYKLTAHPTPTRPSPSTQSRSLAVR